MNHAFFLFYNFFPLTLNRFILGMKYKRSPQIRPLFKIKNKAAINFTFDLHCIARAALFVIPYCRLILGHCLASYHCIKTCVYMCISDMFSYGSLVLNDSCIQCSILNRQNKIICMLRDSLLLLALSWCTYISINHKQFIMLNKSVCILKMGFLYQKEIHLQTAQLLPIW